jgi:hypothetical protein
MSIYPKSLYILMQDSNLQHSYLITNINMNILVHTNSL